MRQKIGVMFGNPETTPGGLALKFYASIRIDVRKIANIKTPGGEAVGSQHRARIIKNKVAPPFKEAEFDIMNTEGISVYGSLTDLAVTHGLITKAGAFFKVDGQNIQGREGVKKYLKDNPKVADSLKSQIWEIIKNPVAKDANSSDQSES
jgi:recombination protein RecA